MADSKPVQRRWGLPALVSLAAALLVWRAFANGGAAFVSPAATVSQDSSLQTRRGFLGPSLAAAAALWSSPPAHADFGKASCTMKVSFPETPCAKVSEVAYGRATGAGGWVDPHNQGAYSVSSSSPQKLEGTRVTGKKGGPEVGGPFTDAWSLKFTAAGEGCSVDAYSTSTSFSLLDASTNYCNLHNLYASGGMQFKEGFTDCGQNDVKECGA